MKKILLILLLAIPALSGMAQSDSLKTIYCELVGSETLLGKTTVEIDMGQTKGLFALNTAYITDEKGKPKKFNSMVDAMNFMGEKGWEFAQAYVVTSSSGNIYHWLLTQTVAKGKDNQYYPVTRKLWKN